MREFFYYKHLEVSTKNNMRHWWGIIRDLGARGSEKFSIYYFYVFYPFILVKFWFGPRCSDL